MLKPLTGGAEWAEAKAGSVGELIDELDRQFPGIGERLCEDGELKPGLTVAVDGRVSPLGLLQRVGDDSEVHFLPAIGGG